MSDIEQRAHDIAIAVISQQQAAIFNKLISKSNSNDIELPTDLGKLINTYCAIFDATCEELAKRMS